MSNVFRTISTAGMTREQWLDLRRECIGGSEAGTIMGYPSYGWTEYKIWLNKLRMLAEQPDVERMEFGRRFEKPISIWWSDKTGTRVVYPDCQFRSIERPWQGCNVDGLIGDDAILEVKNVGYETASDLGEEGSDEIPRGWIFQAQHMMAVTGRQRVEFAVCVGGQKGLRFRVDRYDSLIERLNVVEQEFWRHVETRTPPPVRDSDDVQLMYPEDNHQTIEASADDLNILTKIAEKKKRISGIEAEIDLLEFAIKKRLGQAAVMQFDGRPVCTWKTETAHRIDAKLLRERAPHLVGQFEKVTSTRKFLNKLK